MEVIGTVKKIFDTVQVSSEFSKREIVVTTDEQYPQHISIEFLKDKCFVLDNYSTGQKVKVGINLRGREWTNPLGEVKYFNQIQGWKIENLNDATATQTESNLQDSSGLGIRPEKTIDTFIEQNDDLPF